MPSTSASLAVVLSSRCYSFTPFPLFAVIFSYHRCCRFLSVVLIPLISVPSIAASALMGVPNSIFRLTFLLLATLLLRVLPR